MPNECFQKVLQCSRELQMCEMVYFAVPTFPELSVLLRNMALSKSVQRGRV
jgi:hypothetical protein